MVLVLLHRFFHRPEYTEPRQEFILVIHPILPLDLDRKLQF
jgi:hypothetical protein